MVKAAIEGGEIDDEIRGGWIEDGDASASATPAESNVRALDPGTRNAHPTLAPVSWLCRTSPSRTTRGLSVYRTAMPEGIGGLHPNYDDRSYKV